MSVLGPNSLLPHGSPGRAKTHRAHGAICPVCMPTEERPVVCPVCRHLRTAIGERMVEHTVGGRGWGFSVRRCVGSDEWVPAVAVEDQPVLRRPERRAAA